MSGRAPQRPPRNARRIPPIKDARWGDEPWGEAGLDEWLHANGFPYFVPSDHDLYLSPDGRTLYGEKFLIRVGPSRTVRDTGWVLPRHDYTVTPDGTGLVRKSFAYPITRPLRDHAPAIAEYMGLPA